MRLLLDGSMKHKNVHVEAEKILLLCDTIINIFCINYMNLFKIDLLSLSLYFLSIQT